MILIWSIFMLKNDPLKTCKVCGLYFEDYYPWEPDGKSPTFDICICCGTEFGYEDCTPESAKRARKAWIQGGCKIFNTKYLFKEWKLEESLKNVISKVDIDLLKMNAKNQIIITTEGSGVKIFYDPESDRCG